MVLDSPKLGVLVGLHELLCVISHKPTNKFQVEIVGPDDSDLLTRLRLGHIFCILTRCAGTIFLIYLFSQKEAGVS